MKRVSIRFGVLVCSAVSSLLAHSLVFAEYISPGSVKIETEHYELKPLELDQGTYYYDFAWQGIPVGEGKIRVDSGSSRALTRVQASAKTAEFIDIFYKLRHQSESTFDASSFNPRRFTSWQRENSREKSTEVLFLPGGSIRAEITKNGKEKEPLEFTSKNLTLDPITAAFMARSLPIEVGRTFDFDVFNGKHRYLITFLVQGLETLEIGKNRFKVFKVVPSVQKLTDTEGEKRLESATLWITADESRQVLKLESKVLVGRVRAELRGFEPLNFSPSEKFKIKQVSLGSPGDKS
jgi:hypothetical protein